MRLEHVVWTGGTPATEPELRAHLAADGFEAHLWSDEPRAYYAPHSHERDERLWMLGGEMTFEVAGRSYRLGPGDRLELPAGTFHAATAGAAGATYLIGERSNG
jgi:quercetin dioxygenase-like cupin family protein